MKKLSYMLIAVMATTGLSGAAMAGNVLIINGSSTTSETGTTSSITTQLNNLHTAAGNVVTIADGVPVSLAGYEQVWDIRFSNSSPITAGVQTQYLSYLQGGGGMFVMGENSGFSTRNDSVLSLVTAAGGGSLTFTTPNSNQVIDAPFTGPNAVANVNFLAPGGVTGFGTGQWIARNADGTAGAGVAFGVGDLASAPLGALTVIFDVNFMQTTANAESQALTRNLINFVGVQVGGVPEPSTWAMMIFGFGLAGAAMRRQRKQTLNLTYA
ncbi:MAG: PEPxxWA-CTERM sorting domain-containing protein [Parasphingorhabdus sp.]|nr:PEPxxWA-CTERM sorting domain-containing protein [Parasphingorhabdus sp.]